MVTEFNKKDFFPLEFKFSSLLLNTWMHLLRARVCHFLQSQGYYGAKSLAHLGKYITTDVQSQLAKSQGQQSQLDKQCGLQSQLAR